MSKPYSLSRFDRRDREQPAPEHGRFKNMADAVRKATELNRNLPRGHRYVVIIEEK